MASQDIDVDWINYLEIPLRTEELLKLLEKMQVKPSQVIRMSEEERLSLSEEEVFDLLVAQPELLNRPIVEQDESAFLCRPLEVIKEKMPAYDWSEYF